MSLKTEFALRWAHGHVRLLLLLGLRQKARDALAAQLRRRPDDAHAWATQAHVQAEQGDVAGAVASQKHQLALVPEQAAGWFNLGFLHEQAGELQAAEAAFRRAIDLNPQLDRAWYGLALSLMGQHRLDEALAPLRRNTELQPLSPHGWYQLARVHADRQEHEAATRIIHHLRQFEPKVAAQLVRETGLGGH